MSALDAIPGYGAFADQVQRNQQQGSSNLAQALTLMKIREEIASQQQGQDTRARNEELRAAIAALPPHMRTREHVLPLLLKHGAMKEALPMMSQVEAPKGQPIGAGGLKNPDGSITPPQARAGEATKPPTVRQRYDGTNVIQEEQQPNGTWVEIGRGPRFAPPQPEKPAKLPPPKQGYRYKADGSGDQEPIPGGPADIKIKADRTKGAQSVTLATQNLDALDTALGELHDDPGLSRITGSLFGRIGNVTNDATGAQTKLDSIKSQIFIAALQAMRQASPTGGAVGQVTEKEGDKLENSMGALGQSQRTEDFKAQIRVIRNRLKASRAAIRNAYKEQFGEDLPEPTQGDPAKPGASGQGAGPKEGDKSKSKSGRDIIFRNGRWEYSGG